METTTPPNTDEQSRVQVPERLRREPTHLAKSVLQRTKTDLLIQNVVHETARYATEKKIVRKQSSRARTSDSEFSFSEIPGELKHQNEAEASQEDDNDVSRQSTSVPVFSTEWNSSDEYDTDLEVEVREETPLDKWGKRTYNRSCRRMGLDPIGTVVRGLKTPHVVVKGRGMDRKDALALAFALLNNTNVKTLSLEENCLGDKGTEYIALMLYENKTIRMLNLSCNNIASPGVRSILEMLLENNNITALDLSGNNLSDTDAYMFAEYLEEKNSLEQLVLSHNDFGDIAGAVLGPAIGVNESLKKLDLSWNKIRSSGGVAISRGVGVNVGLLTLNLAYNGLSNTGAHALAETLKCNDILRDLDLSCNRIFDEGLSHIGRALNVNQTLRILRISNNPLTTVSAIGLLNVIKNNKDSVLELLDMSSIHIYRNALTVKEEISRIRPSFKFQYGGVVNSDDSIGSDDQAFDNRNPLTILKEYIASKNLRLVDLFKQFDKDGGGSISREEFIDGLRTIEVPLTQSQLDRLITMLDQDGDGEVDYGELVAGDREHRRKMMKLKQEAITRMSKVPKKKEAPKQKLLSKRL